MSNLNIYEYENYRSYLADYYKTKKDTNPSYSYRVFSARAGIGSPSHYKMVVEGQRNLSAKTIAQYAKALGLNRKETQFFFNLVMYNQVSDLDTKTKYLEEIWHQKSKVNINDLARSKFKFLSKWYVVAIYVLIDTWDFENDLEWISRRLKKKITPTQAKEALGILQDLQMTFEDESGRLRQNSGGLSVADDTKSIAVYHYHTDMMKLAFEALKKESTDTREYNGATVAIPKDKLPVVKEKIRKFRKELNEICSSFEHPEEVYQLNIQFFKLTED